MDSATPAPEPYGSPEYEAIEFQGWRLYYEGGRTADSSEFSWDEAPSDGVQVLMLYEEPPYRTPVYGFDRYLLPGGSSEKLGSLLTDREFDAIQRQAIEDADWPSGAES